MNVLAQAFAIWAGHLYRSEASALTVTDDD